MFTIGRRAATVMLGVMVLLGPGVASAQTMYAKQDRVKVTEDKSPMSRVVETLRLGDRVRVLEKSGRHYKVRGPSGKSGWVFKFRLSDTEIRSGGGGDALSALTGESRIAAREARTGGSIRGLKEVSERYAERKHLDPASRHAVQRMEDRTISRERLLEFQREGSVGEFAGG